MILYILSTVLLVGCAHPRPDQWWPNSHKDMMQECRVLCLNKVRSYDPITGTCSCHKGGR